jgi:putative tricarboxylic transport membrane protein
MTKSLACGLVTILVAAIYLYAASGLRTSLLADTVGSAGFPKVIGWGMALTGVVIVLQDLWARARGRTVVDAEGWIPSAAFRNGALRATLRAAGVVAIILVYLVLFEPAGYLVAATVLIGATAVYLGAAASWTTALVAVLGAVALWLLFGVLLQIPLPMGPLEAWL